MASVNYSSTRLKANNLQRLSDVESIRVALQQYRQDNGFFPSVLTPGNALLGPGGKTYLKTIPDSETDSYCTEPFSYSLADNGMDYNFNYCLSTNVDRFDKGNCSANKMSACWACQDNQDCGACKKCVNKVCTNQSAGEDLKNDCSDINCSAFVSGWISAACKKYTTATGNNGKCDGTGVCASGIAGNCTGAADSAVCGSEACIKPSPTCNNGAAQSDNDTVAKVCYTSGQHSCASGYVCDSTGTCLCSMPAVPPDTITAVTSTIGQVQLSWTAVTGVTNYYIYRDGAQKQVTAALSWLDSTVTPGTTYNYQVSADVCGVLSASSSLAVVARDEDFSTACSSGSSIGDACNGGWLICKPNDGYCGTGYNYYVSVAPVDVGGKDTWGTAETNCTNYINDGFGTWSLPDGQTGSNTEFCQMRKRSNRYSSLGINSCAYAPELTPRPITGFPANNSEDNYWGSYASSDNRKVLSYNGIYNLVSRWTNNIYRARCVKRVAP